MTLSPRVRIRLITLGGTIASVPQPDGSNAVPRLSAHELVAGLGGSTALESIELSVSDFRQKPSGDLTITDMVELAALITGLDDGQTVDGVVITQGTDTLEETAFLLDLLVGVALPVVLTGAMRHSGQPGGDGPANLVGALLVAASPLAWGLGPVVYFADEVHLPRFVRKGHTSSVSAFQSPQAGPIGWVAEGRVRIPLLPRTRTVPLPGPVEPGPLPRVALVRVGLDTDASLIEAVLQADHAGLVVEAFGGGHVPAALIPALTAAAERMPVVYASRTGAGEVYGNTYGFVGSERDLLGHGLIGAGCLDGVKARLLLTLLLAAVTGRSGIAARFAASME
jgi:L-asparaginase